MTPDTYAVRDEHGNPTGYTYGTRAEAEGGLRDYPGGTVVGLVGVDRLGSDHDLWAAIANALAPHLPASASDQMDAFAQRDATNDVLAALRAELEES